MIGSRVKIYDANTNVKGQDSFLRFEQDAQRTSNKIINNQDYRLIESYETLVPLQPGKLKLPTIEMQTKLLVQSRSPREEEDC